MASFYTMCMFLSITDSEINDIFALVLYTQKQSAKSICNLLLHSPFSHRSQNESRSEQDLVPVQLKKDHGNQEIWLQLM